MSPDPVALAATKFTAPHVPSSLVRRPRLIDALDAAAERALTLLAAPAGAGKSALLSSWIARRPERAVAWYSLDAADGERRSFWRGTLEALRRTGVGDPLASLAIHPSEPVDVVLPSLVNALEALDEPVTLVLDDVHEIDGSPGLADLDRLLRRPPSGLRVVLSTRADPALRLGRLRLAGELTEIRGSDLAFTLDETIELLAASGVEVGANVAAQLWERTEGWSAGLRLATLTMRSHGDPERFVAEFAGDDRTIADYLLAEVLSRQPPAVRDFLLRIAIVDGVSGELANALTGRTDGGRILAGLEHDHALLSSTGGVRSWYRLHPLFAELLRSELAYAAPDEIAVLHGRAAGWFEARDEPTQAVRHAAAAEDWPRVGALVGAHWVPLLLGGQLQSLRPLLARLPDALVRDRPELALAVAGSYVDAGSEEDARPWFGIACAGRDRVPPERLDRFDLGIATVGLLRGRLQGDLGAAMRNARSIIDESGREPIADEDSRALAFTHLGIAELWHRDLERAGRHLETARAAAHAAGRDWLLVLCSAHLAAQCVATGRFDRAVRLCDEADALVQRRGWEGTWLLGVTALARGSMALHRNHLDEAEVHQHRADSYLHESTDRALRGVAAIHATRVLLARGRLGAAADTVQEAREWLHDWPAGAPLQRTLDSLEAMVEALSGERERATAALETDAPTLETRVGMARLHFQAGEAALALTALGSEDEVPAVYATRIEARILTALAHDALAEHDAAATALERAMDAAERNGVKRPFLAHGRAIGPLLRRQRRHGTAHRALLEHLVEQVERPAGDRARLSLPEALSDREAAVLRFLPTMMSNQEIAAELFVSVNTVKTHLKAIYRKLDVDDRRGAVRRARELALLGPL